MNEPATFTPIADMKPPVRQVGAVAWLRENLFNNWFNSLLTVLTLAVLGVFVPPLIKWAFVDSLWYSSAEACRDIDGACWSIIPRITSYNVCYTKLLRIPALADPP